MTLTEFLLARYVADEADALRCQSRTWRYEPSWQEHFGTVWNGIGQAAASHHEAGAGPHIARWDPARVLAECAAKRRMVSKVFEQAAIIDGEWGCCHSAETLRAGVEDYGDGELVALPTDCDGLRVVAEWLSILALPYADHPDYREEWRP